MIQVQICCSKDGVLHECLAQGHAGFGKPGEDIVCAAVTTLLRTTISVLSKDSQFLLETEITERGKLAFHVSVNGASSNNEKAADKLKYAGSFLVDGLTVLQKEYPECVLVELREVN